MLGASVVTRGDRLGTLASAIKLCPGARLATTGAPVLAGEDVPGATLIPASLSLLGLLLLPMPASAVPPLFAAGVPEAPACPEGPAAKIPRRLPCGTLMGPPTALGESPRATIWPLGRPDTTFCVSGAAATLLSACPAALPVAAPLPLAVPPSTVALAVCCAGSGSLGAETCGCNSATLRVPTVRVTVAVATGGGTTAGWGALSACTLASSDVFSGAGATAVGWASAGPA